MIAEQVTFGALEGLPIPPLRGQVRNLAENRFPYVSLGILALLRRFKVCSAKNSHFPKVATFRRYGSRVIPGGMGGKRAADARVSGAARFPRLRFPFSSTMRSRTA